MLELFHAPCSETIHLVLVASRGLSYLAWKTYPAMENLLGYFVPYGCKNYVSVDYRKIVPGGQPLYSAWVELLSPDFKLWSLTELLVPSLAEPALMPGCRKSHRSCPHRTLAGCPQSLSFLALCQAAHPHLWLQKVSNRSSIHCCVRKQCQCPICHRPCKFGIGRWCHTSGQCSQSSKELAFQPMLVLCQYNLRLLRP